MADMPRTAHPTALHAAFARHGITDCALLASTYRSGSTFIAGMLANNGLPGLGKERFNDIWQVDAIDTGLDTIIAPFAGGRFPAKLMWPHRNNLAQKIGAPRDASLLLANAFPRAAWLFVRRRDSFRQVISFWRAKRTDRWHIYTDQPEPDLEYSFAEIDTCARELALHERLWQDFFARAEVTPYVVWYEDVLTHPGILNGYLARFGGRITTTQVSLKKQSDDRSERYLDQYLSDLYARGD